MEKSFLKYGLIFLWISFQAHAQELKVFFEPKVVEVNQAVKIEFYILSEDRIEKFFPIKFPKLENFIRRFYIRSYRSKILKEKGKKIHKKIIYSAYLFPRKPGKLVIDPFKLKIERIKGKKKNIELQSKPHFLTVKKTPPRHKETFIGETKISASVTSKNSYSTIKFKVDSKAPLEIYDGPELVNEEKYPFISRKTSMNHYPSGKAVKVIEDTFEGALTFKDLDVIYDMNFFVFDPKANKTHKKNIDLRKESGKQQIEVNEIGQKVIKNKNKVSLFWEINNFLFTKIEYIILLFFVLSFFTFFSFKRKERLTINILLRKFLKTHKISTINYSQLYKLFSLLKKKYGLHKTNIEILSSLNCSNKLRRNMVNLLEDSQQNEFSKEKRIKSFSAAEKKVIKDFFQYIQVNLNS